MPLALTSTTGFARGATLGLLKTVPATGLHDFVDLVQEERLIERLGAFDVSEMSWASVVIAAARTARSPIRERSHSRVKDGVQSVIFIVGQAILSNVDDRALFDNIGVKNADFKAFDLLYFCMHLLIKILKNKSD